MLLSVMVSINAKTKVVTLWDGTDTGENNRVERSSLVAGATVTLEFNWLGTDDGAQFSCFYWKNNAWTYLYSWQWVNNGATYSFSLTQEQIDDIPTDQPLYFKTEVPSKMTFKKITSTTEIVPTNETELLNASWTASETAKVFSAQTGAKVKDVIKFTYTAYKDDETDWPWVMLNLKDSDDGALDALAVSKAKNSTNTYEYEITDFDVLDKIQTGGFKVTGQQCIVTSVKLLTYEDSYTPVSVTIGSDGIAAWSHDQNLDFSGTDIKVYYASATSDGEVILSPTTTTWNWQGYILKGDEGTYRVGVVPDSEATFPSGNLLRGHVNAGTVYRSVYSDYSGDATGDELTNIKTKYRYILAKSDSDTDGSTIGFYRLTGDHTLGANKAYLETTTTGNNARVNLVFGDESETTGIGNVDVNANDNIDAPMYNLAGQRVGKSYKGIVIVNGKKYFNK